MTQLVKCRHDWAVASATATPVCTMCHVEATLWVNHGHSVDVLYSAQPKQLEYHFSALPNLLLIGPRGTGKTLCPRMDAHMRAMAIPKFRYLVMRTTMPELKKTHIFWIHDEMSRLGGDFHITDSVAQYPNGSRGWFGHCETIQDTNKYLSAEYDLIVADEIVMFDPELVLRMMSCIRVPEGSGRVGMFRGSMNKLGRGAEFCKKYFVDRSVPAEENADYDPDDFGFISMGRGDNVYTDYKQYDKRLALLPEHVRKAWRDDEWIIEGAYFTDFVPFRDGDPWHVIMELPRIEGIPVIAQPWVAVYRCIDWGYYPDPAVCLWIAVLPNKRAIVFKERTWKQTLAGDVAKAIKRESEGMNIIQTFCDPTMLINDGKGAFTTGAIFEQNGVSLTPSVNKRDVYGYAIHEHLNTLVTEAQGEKAVTYPKLQILAGNNAYGSSYGCPNLIRTIPILRVDANDPNKIADGDDHWAVALAYFCMGDAMPSHDPKKPLVPRWMQPKWRKQPLQIVG